MTAINKAEVVAAAVVAARSSRAESWRRAGYRFRASKLSVVGLVIVLALLLMAAVGPWVVLPLCHRGVRN